MVASSPILARSDRMCVRSACRLSSPWLPPHTRATSQRWVSSLPGWVTIASSSCHSVGVSRSGTPASCRGPLGQVDHQVAVRQALVGLVAHGAPAQRPQPRGELGEPERLLQEVVRAAVERADLALLVGVAGQDQDRHVEPAAQPADDLDAVDVGQPEVEDHEVGRLGRGQVDGLQPGGGAEHPLALALQRPAQGMEHLRLVVDHQDRPHAPMLGGPGRGLHDFLTPAAGLPHAFLTGGAA